MGEGRAGRGGGGGVRRRSREEGLALETRSVYAGFGVAADASMGRLLGGRLGVGGAGGGGCCGGMRRKRCGREEGRLAMCVRRGGWWGVVGWWGGVCVWVGAGIIVEEWGGERGERGGRRGRSGRARGE